ncbi:MAG TPA: hypothetical protein VLB01_06235 [Thermodesulfobacteriota bacterium]|nr:hypothetical protein [Thermodesulfobacteriota bacterium]
MSRWEKFMFEDRIRKILQNVEYYQESHHFGRPFLTAYQIAIECAHRYPDDFNQIGLPIGGRGIGQHTSLAQYIAGELSRRMRNGELPDFEGSFISNKHLSEISFEHNDLKVVSSLTNTEYDLSIFRLIDGTKDRR